MNNTSDFQVGYSCKDWERHYEEKDMRWDLDEVAPPFIHLWEKRKISPCNAIVPGCGAGHEVIFLAERGYMVFRMGKIVEKPFNLDHPLILDYANSTYRSDFLDIWLLANCFFCISTGVGLEEVARIFRKPIVNVNYLPLSNFVSYSQCISVPKHLVWKDTKKKLTASEHFVHSYLLNFNHI